MPLRQGIQSQAPAADKEYEKRKEKVALATLCGGGVELRSYDRLQWGFPQGFRGDSEKATLG
jgi:hypothetical protein